MENVTTRRYRLTLRGLMIFIAGCALVLLPYARSVRKLELLKEARLRGAYEAKVARFLGRKTRQEALRALNGTSASPPGRASTSSPPSAAGARDRESAGKGPASVHPGS